MKKHWWHAFASFSPSSRNNDTKASASDDTLVGAGARYSLRPSNLFSNRRSNSRGRKVRPSDVEVWRNQTAASRNFSSSSPDASPQPLPLPELQTLLRTDKRSTSVNSASNNYVRLPSPREMEKGDVAANRVTINDGAPTSYSSPRLISQDSKRNSEQAETWSSKKSPQGNHRFRSVPASAPTTPYSSPRNSPVDIPPSHFEYLSSPSLFQVWSAPEMPLSDPTLVPTFAYPKSSEINADNASLPSPNLSLSKSPNGTLSPLSNRPSVEISLGQRDNSAQANVHPLPLPPGAYVPSSQPVIHSQPAAKVDIVPLKSQWQKGKLIGRGTFGSVYVASNKETGALCAMKEVEMLPDDPKSAECIKQLEQEIQVLSHLQHPNIVQYFGSEIVGDRFYIYLEYVHPGSLNRFISDHCGGITESVVRNFTRHILCGLAYLHSTKTIHRDIKGANLLVDAYGVVKLADFGMAKHLNGHAANLSLKGSPYWMAPELMQSVMHQDTNVDLAMAVDIWSLGCTIIEMFTGKPPWSEYEGAAAMFKVLKENPPIPENLSAEGKDFLGCCFRRNPAERASATMLLEHRFLRNPHAADVLSNSMERVKSKIDQLSLYADHMQTTKAKLTDHSLLDASLSHMRLANEVSTKL